MHAFQNSMNELIVHANFSQGWELIGLKFHPIHAGFKGGLQDYVIVYLSPQNGQTALMLAGNSGHTVVVQLLLSSGAKIDLQNKVRPLATNNHKSLHY